MSKKSNNYKFSLRHKVQSSRQLRVAQLINTAVIDCIRKGRMLDIRLINCPISITKVTVSADLQIANCFFVPFNTQLSSDELLDALDQSKYSIRKYVTTEINLKFSPELRFFFDKDFERSNILDNLI